MNYDPIKKDLGIVFNKFTILRKIFYSLLDLLLLRSWHIHRELKTWIAANPNAIICDAGSGFGQYSYFLAKHKNKYTIDSLDVMEKQIADCMAKTISPRIAQAVNTWEHRKPHDLCTVDSDLQAVEAARSLGLLPIPDRIRKVLYKNIMAF
jgi:hypothetical protein